MLKGNENEGLSTSHFIHRNQSLQYAPFVDNTNWKPAESQLSAPSTSSSILVKFPTKFTYINSYRIL